MNRLRVVRLGAVLFVSALFPGLASAGPGDERVAPRSQLRPGGALDGHEGRQARVRHERHARGGRRRATASGTRSKRRRAGSSCSSTRCKRTKAPLWDNAKMAAMLTNITRIPYDSQHLPMTTRPTPGSGPSTRAADAEVGEERHGHPLRARGAEGREDRRREGRAEARSQKTGRRTPEGRRRKADDKKDGRGRSRASDPEEPKTTKTLYFEYDLATGKLALLPDFKPDPKKPGWAQVSPDDKTVVFARGHNLFMMDEENYKLALKDFGDAKIQEVQLTTDGEEHYSFARRLTDEAKTTLKKDQKGDTKHKDGPRVPAIGVQWAKDSKKFSAVRERPAQGRRPLGHQLARPARARSSRPTATPCRARRTSTRTSCWSSTATRRSGSR